MKNRYWCWPCAVPWALPSWTMKTTCPPDERYYAGGGNSIRDFEFQSIGPCENDDPVGGGSVVEFSAATAAWGIYDSQALADSVTRVIFYMIPLSTRLDKGIRILSNINITVVLLLMLYILFLGPTAFAYSTFATSLGTILSEN